MAVYISFVLSSFIFSLFELFTDVRKERWFKLLQYLFIISLFVSYAFNRGNTDYENYIKIFNGEMEVAEKGYLFLNSLIKAIGGSYNIVPLILGVFMIFCLFCLYKTDYPISFIFFYVIMTFMFDVNQIRNMFCSLFILVGIFYLNKNTNFIYVFFNIIAMLFQRIGIIYFCFFILNKFNLKKYKKIIFFIFIAELLCLNVFPYILTEFFPDKAYYLERQTHLSPLAYAVYLFINLLILKLTERGKNSVDEEIFIKLILFPIIFLPTSFFFLEILTRVVRFSNYIKWFYFFKYIRKREKIGTVLVIFLLLLLQEIFLWGVGFYHDPSHRIGLMNEISNIDFYF